jgi:hypothetical protein
MIAKITKTAISSKVFVDIVPPAFSNFKLFELDFETLHLLWGEGLRSRYWASIERRKGRRLRRRSGESEFEVRRMKNLVSR